MLLLFPLIKYDLHPLLYVNLKIIFTKNIINID